MSIQTQLSMMGNVCQIQNVPGQFIKKWREYTVQITRDAVASSIPGSQQMQIDPNTAPFLCVGIHVGDTADGNALTSQEDFFINAQDNQNGYTWCNGFVPRTALAGGREFGLNFPEEFAIRSNTRITWSVQNKPAGPTAGVTTITLRGWQLIAI